MEIEKYPDKFDMNIYEKEKANKKARICPFCGESRLLESVEDIVSSKPGIEEGAIYKSWYGHRDEGNDTLRSFFSSLNPFKKSHNWRQDLYCCHTCGAKWYTDPYRTDYGPNE